jgi:uncharacterized SAM-binding protein YcdF (DUF218 family)
VILEAKSRDTYENAEYLRDSRAGEVGPSKRWLLITSAYHMPRAMGAFRQAGFNVEPCRWTIERGKADLTGLDKVSELAAGGGLARMGRLLAYWLTGRRCVISGAQPLAVVGCDSQGPALMRLKARQHPHVDPTLR